MAALLQISAADIRRLVTFDGLIAHLRSGHARPCADYAKALLNRQENDGETNSFLIWPAWDGDQGLGIKIATIFPENPARKPPEVAVQAIYLLFDGDNGTPVALIDGTELTYWKTAANSALACDVLARRDARTLLMVGAGDLAPFLVRAHLSVRPAIDTIRIWNRTAAKAETLAHGLREEFASRDVGVCADLEAGVGAAHVICCATAATAPLIEGAALSPGAHLDLVGGFRPDMREADGKAMARARLFVEQTKYTPRYAGEIVQAIDEGYMDANHVLGDLFDLVSRRVAGRLDKQDITAFKTSGGGHLDLMTGRFIHDCYQTSLAHKEAIA